MSKQNYYSLEKTYNKKYASALFKYMGKNANIIHETITPYGFSKDSSFKTEEAVYHYSSSTVFISKTVWDMVLNPKYKSCLKVVSNNESLTEKVFGELEKVLLGRK